MADSNETTPLHLLQLRSSLLRRPSLDIGSIVPEEMIEIIEIRDQSGATTTQGYQQRLIEVNFRWMTIYFPGRGNTVSELQLTTSTSEIEMTMAGEICI